MQHEQIWAPWRLPFLQGVVPIAETPPSPAVWRPGAEESCFFCRYAGTPIDDARNHVLWRGQKTFAVLNRYPYNNGHTMVAPLDHQGRLDELDDATHLEAMQTLTKLTAVMARCMNAEGFNVGLNLGKIAGAGVPGHLHWHIVPRWAGDNNFMPVVAAVHVIPQSLDALTELLTDELRTA